MRTLTTASPGAPSERNRLCLTSSLSSVRTFSKDLDQHVICTDTAPDSRSIAMLHSLSPTLVHFSSGSSALFLTRPVDLSLLGMQHAMIEILSMRAAALLIASENSSFGMAAHSWSRAVDWARGGNSQRGASPLSL